MTVPERPDAAAAAARMAGRPVRPERAPNPVLADDEAAAMDSSADGSMVDERRKQWETTVPRKFRDARTSDWTGQVGDDLTEWAKSTEPGNLLVFGAVGVGKSRAATAACRRGFAAGRTLSFLPVGELLDSLDWRRADSHQTLEHLCRVDLLVVDDLGTERSNEWTGERLYLVVNRRWLDELPTLITTNLTPDELTTEVGERTYSRLRDGATAIMLTGEDRRRAR